MRTLITLLGKEFKQIFRNKLMLPVIFIIPVVQMIVLVYAASLEMNNIKKIVVDKDFSTTSRRLTSQFNGSPFFLMQGNTEDIKLAKDLMARDKVDVILHFRKGFDKQLYN